MRARSPLRLDGRDRSGHNRYRASPDSPVRHDLSGCKIWQDPGVVHFFFLVPAMEEVTGTQIRLGQLLVIPKPLEKAGRQRASELDFDRCYGKTFIDDQIDFVPDVITEEIEIPGLPGVNPLLENVGDHHVLEQVSREGMPLELPRLGDPKQIRCQTDIIKIEFWRFRDAFPITLGMGLQGKNDVAGFQEAAIRPSIPRATD